MPSSFRIPPAALLLRHPGKTEDIFEIWDRVREDRREAALEMLRAMSERRSND